MQHLVLISIVIPHPLSRPWLVRQMLPSCLNFLHHLTFAQTNNTPAHLKTRTPSLHSQLSLLSISSHGYGVTSSASCKQPLPEPMDIARPSPASPCAACKLLRRRCSKECIFAPYFLADEPHKFVSVHRVFGASNVSKMLQEIPLQQRADAVSSMVYEANARIRDPVYGCVGTISQLQEQVVKLQKQLALAQAEIVYLRMQHESMQSQTELLATSSTTVVQPFLDLETKPSPVSSTFNQSCETKETFLACSKFACDKEAVSA